MLTTERQQFEAWFTNKYPRSYWGVEKTASGEYQGGLAAPLWEAWKESRGCMANRQAQPVAVMYKDGHVLTKNECGNAFDICCRVQTPLYTAPPAPAVPGELRNVYRAEGLAEVLKDAREYAPLTAEQWGTLVKNWHQTFVGLSGDANSCRAAMLTQPVSQGYKLPPHAYRELVNSLRDTAVKYSGTDQLRERLNTALHQFIEPDPPHTRTVAPEGSCD